jgi:PilZ domain
MPDDPKKVCDGAAAFAAPEHRRYPRYSFTAGVQAVDTAQRSVLNARISDLGRGGCYIDAFSPFPLKTGVKLRITSEKRSFEAHAVVVYSKTGMGMGLAFTTVEPEQLLVLDRWLAELSGAAPFEPGPSEENGENHGKKTSDDEQCFALVERTISLIRQGNLTSEQGKTLLRNLLCNEPKA